MKRDIRLLFLICAAALAGVLLFQAFWLKNYYTINKERFEKEVNLAFEDAVKKELISRNDTLEHLLYQYLADTTLTSITSGISKEGSIIYHIATGRDPRDKYSFSYKDFNFPITSPADTNRLRIARFAARMYREEDLDRHIIFYRTQAIGKYIGAKADSLSFDTVRLRPILGDLLAQRNISEPFRFLLKDSDNNLNKNYFPDSVSQEFPVITKAFPTYKNRPGENYVRTMFRSPGAYLFSKSKFLLLGSMILTAIIALSFYYLLRIIRKQKRLADIKDDFINNVTHEFKTPIATVYAAIEALDDFAVVQDIEKTKKYLRISKTELQRLSNLVTKILNISLYENPEHELRREPVNIDMIVQEVMQVYQHAFPEKVKFFYHNLSESCIVTGDKTHIYNSINNLVDNSIKYSEGLAEVEIILSNKGPFVVIEVKDQGIGIGKEQLGYVFDKFFRVSPRSNSYGLGLSYTKSVVEKHRGWCTAQSEPGKGSKFSIGLPLHEQ